MYEFTIIIAVYKNTETEAALCLEVIRTTVDSYQWIKDFETSLNDSSKQFIDIGFQTVHYVPKSAIQRVVIE